MENLSQASTRFGLDLFRIVCADKPSENGFISPLSLSVALSMTQLGADGETAKGMAKGLHWYDGKEAAIHEDNQKYISMLQEVNEEYILTIANRLYVEKGYTLLPEFLQQTEKLYLAQAVPCNFKSNAEHERVNINSWVSEQTKDRIKDLLAEGVLNQDTKMVLVNAVYFKGKWSRPFESKDTRSLPFKVSPTSTKSVPTMTGEKTLSYYLDNGTKGFSALELPYKGEGLSMVILLPKNDFDLDTMEKNLTLVKLVSIFSRLRKPEKIKVRLPKFEMTCSYQMKEPLCHMGMAAMFSPVDANFSKMTLSNGLYMSEIVHKTFVKVDEEGLEATAATAVVAMTCSYQMKEPLSGMGMAAAFNPARADFGKMTPSNDLYVSEVVHKAFVKVDEEGSEAAAATAVVMMLRCAMIPQELPEFFVDHPFFFVIRDQRASDSILFMGRVTDPSSA